MALSFRYRVDAAPTGPLHLSLGQGRVDLTDLLKAAPAQQWRSVKVRLSCFRNAGADLAHVETPFQLASSAAVTVSIAEVRLASNESDTICPAP